MLCFVFGVEKKFPLTASFARNAEESFLHKNRLPQFLKQHPNSLLLHPRQHLSNPHPCPRQRLSNLLLSRKRVVVC